LRSKVKRKIAVETLTESADHTTTTDHLLTPLVPYIPQEEKDLVPQNTREAIDKLRKNLDADCYTISGLFQRDEIDFDQWEQWLRQKLADYCQEYNTKFSTITGESIDMAEVLKTCYGY